jgi:Rieske Fe-S protein
MEDPRPNPGTIVTGTGVSRRTVVLGVSAVGAAGLLTACGGSSGGDSTAASSDDSGSDPSPSESGSASASDDSGGEKLAKTADVPVGGGSINKSAKVVVTQPAAGTYKAFTAVCTHMQCLVGSVVDNVIHCPCHGSEYNATDGTVKQGPAPKPLTAVPVTVQGDEIVKA